MRFSDIYKEVQYCTIVVTNACNINCRYCFEQSKGSDIMDPDLARQVIEKIRHFARPMSNNNPFKLVFFGGEPLIAWNTIKTIYDYLANFKDFKYQTGATTNLTLLTDEMIDYWTAIPTFLTVSIDGGKLTHNRNRCNTFNMVTSNIKKLNKNNIDFEARMTITADDIDSIYDNVKFLHEDLNCHTIIPQYDTVYKFSDEELSRYEDQMIKVIEYTKDVLNDSGEFILGRSFDRLRYIDLNNKVLDRTKKCFFHENRTLTIDWNGNIVACMDSPTVADPSKYTYGSILSDNINGADLASNFNIPEDMRCISDICRECECLSNVCNGECYLYMKEDGRDKFGYNKTFCKFQKIYRRLGKMLQDA